MPHPPIPVELAKAYRLLNHGPATLISSAFGGQRNVMAASWVTPLDFDPPKVSLVIDKHTFSRPLVERSGELVINIPRRAQLDQLYAAGCLSGREHDKFAELGIDTQPASRVTAPLIAGCVAWLECRILAEPHIQQAYDLFVAEVVAAWADPAVFDGRHWHFDQPQQRTVHHVAGGAFFATGEALQAQRVSE